jgi:hypothetical protein
MPMEGVMALARADVISRWSMAGGEEKREMRCFLQSPKRGGYTIFCVLERWRQSFEGVDSRYGIVTQGEKRRDSILIKLTTVDGGILGLEHIGFFLCQRSKFYKEFFRCALAYTFDSHEEVDAIF